MKLSNLSDDCLLAIFRELSISALFTVEFVCRHWHQLQYYEQTRFTTQRYLVVLCPAMKSGRQSIPPVRHLVAESYIDSPDCHLVLPNLSHPLILQALICKFLRITTVEFYLDQMHLKALTSLFEQCTQLASVKVTIIKSGNNRPTVENWNHLLVVLNGMANLRHLVVEDLNHDFIKSNSSSFAVTIPDLSDKGIPPQTYRTFANLETLYFGFPLANCPFTLIYYFRNHQHCRRFGQVKGYQLVAEERHIPPVDGSPTQPYLHYCYTAYFRFEPSTYCTHFSHTAPIEWSEYYQGTLYYQRQVPRLAYPFQLTHLSLRTELPLKLFFTRYRLWRLVELQYLKVTAGNGYLVRFSLRHKPLYTLPRPPETAPVYRTLSTLHLVHLPHSSFEWAKLMFPSLKRMVAEVRPDEANFVCEKCKDDDGSCSVGDCQAVFLQSLSEWPTLQVQLVGQVAPV